MEARFPELTVVLLAYNEEGCVEDVTRRTAAYLVEAVERPELVLVDDGSTDATGSILDGLGRELSGTLPTVVRHHGANRGMGAALRTGYAAATREFVTFLPADGQIDPRDLSRLFPPVASGADLVVSRYESRDDALVRHVLSRGLRLLTWLMTGSRTPNQGPYLFRRRLWEEIGPKVASESFFLNLEFVILCERAGVPIGVATLRALARQAGRSKVTGLRRIARVAGELLRMRLRHGRGLVRPAVAPPGGDA